MKDDPLLDNLEEINKFLETYNGLKLNHEEIETLNRPVTNKDIESVIKNLLTKKCHCFFKESFHIDLSWLSWEQILINDMEIWNALNHWILEWESLDIIHSDSDHCSLNLSHVEGLLQHKLLGATVGVSNSIVLGWDLRICIFNELPGDADHTKATLQARVKKPTVLTSCRGKNPVLPPSVSLLCVTLLHFHTAALTTLLNTRAMDRVFFCHNKQFSATLAGCPTI